MADERNIAEEIFSEKLRDLAGMAHKEGARVSIIVYTMCHLAGFLSRYSTIHPNDKKGTLDAVKESLDEGWDAYEKSVPERFR
jgi:hypothetical protein